MENKKWKLLVVEDKLSNRELMDLYLGKTCDLVFSIDGSDLYEKVSQKRFDAILMDVKLGRKNNGVEYLKELKSSEDYKHIPVLATTACSQEEIIDVEFDGYIQKPFYRSELIQAIDKLVS